MIQQSIILLAPQASRVREKAARWLCSRCELVSQLIGCTVTRHSFLCSQASGVLAAAVVALCADGVAEYGWAALCAVEAVRLARPVLKEIKGQKGGEL